MLTMRIFNSIWQKVAGDSGPTKPFFHSHCMNKWLMALRCDCWHCGVTSVRMCELGMVIFVSFIYRPRIAAASSL